MAISLTQTKRLYTWVSKVMAIGYLFLLSVPLTVGIEVDYLTTNCNSTITAQIAGVIEPESRLYYSNNVDCITTLKTSEGRLLLQFYRFALEDYVNNECVDKLVVYDGPDTNSTQLTDDMCGRKRPEDVESTGDSLTFRFVSDDDGQSLGFGIYYTTFTEAPCSQDKFKCNNSKCIAASLVCDSYDMCGDNTDEENCDDDTGVESGGLSIAVIFAILVGSICFVIAVILIVYTIKEKQRQKKLTEQILKESVLRPSDNNYCDKDFWGPR
ncbi:low-density lipoprotein receptor-related protein 12-like [Anneissia japonica]|uniref:low-density lipoprotein receptor-related protein 12-like n=1 Tax=Anneissia japonica TaxID=1529436 RepID=UPI00142565E1|nr:low-density lipoprotein receptor-related protein 12-like [Anneissia japonica]